MARKKESSTFQIDSILFSTWVLSLQNYVASPDMDSTTERVNGPIEVIGDPILPRLRKTRKREGMPFPADDNLRDTLTLCDQFVNKGRVDVFLLHKVQKQAQSDLRAIRYYYKEFKDMDHGDGFGMPMKVMTFGYPASLVDYMKKHIDPALGLVTGLDEKQRGILADMIQRNVSALKQR